MAEPSVNAAQKHKLIEQEEEPDQENKESSGAVCGTSSSVVAGMNLVLMLSFLSLSPEEQSSSLTGETEEILEGKGRKHGCGEKSDVPVRRRQIMMDGFPTVERHAASKKMHTKIRDCRHSRKF